VAADSQAETFAAARLEIQSWRWSGVPFLIRAVMSNELSESSQEEPTNKACSHRDRHQNYEVRFLSPRVSFMVSAPANSGISPH